MTRKVSTSVAAMAMVSISQMGFSPCVSATPAAPPRGQVCDALMRADLSNLLDAPTQIMEALSVAATDTQPAYCQIRGYVTSNVGFLLRLPVAQWNGKLLEIGCGGYCGSTDHISQCDDPVRRGYACIVSDGGHRSASLDAKWAYNNLQAIVDHYYRAPHVTAVAGKALVERYYQQPARRAYFMGCSAGGRQALMEAQRFPWDFDGIVAGAPTLSMPKAHMNMLWSIRSFNDSSGKALLTQQDLEWLHRAVLDTCDTDDGLRDGLIGDPRACSFDPAALRCSERKVAHCLTAKQVEAVQKLYEGPKTSQGVHICMPAALRGSELTWPLFTILQSLPAEIFRYIAFQPSPGPTWKAEDFDFDRDYKRFGIEGMISSLNPDLRAFESAGGKLLAYAGWNDAIGMPLHAVDYYETTERTMGGREATQKFFRLFMIPGMNHCTGGDGAFAVDYLGALDAWVERGQAPERLVGSHVELKTIGEGLHLSFPLRRENIRFSRPFYPYPIQARYRGRGDPNAADSFGPFQP